MSMRHRGRVVSTACLVVFAACSSQDQQPLGPTPDLHRASQPAADPLVTIVRQLAVQRGIGPLPRAPRIPPSLARLGRALAFDKILSGNRDISCMTCHLPAYALGDARSLAIGQGGVGLGPSRTHPTGAFIPRNAPSLFNLTALQSLFWDGRVEQDLHGHLHTPVGNAITPAMERVLQYGPASALGLFPVLSRSEMRGDDGNELAAVPDSDPQTVWQGLMDRLGRIPAYRQLFEAAYPGTPFRTMTFAHASNAIAGFLIDEFTFADTPWDRFLAGDDRALTDDQLAGAQTFLSIKCSICHNGPAFTDNQFHNVAIAQFGPGEGDGANGRDDFGRMRVTGRSSDRYLFRTTPLRNVELTGPYGHDGAFAQLHDFIDHYSESDLKLEDFDPTRLEPLLQNTLQPTAAAILATRDTIIDGVVLPPATVDQLTTFMSALTDPRARYLDRVVPRRVPSGLPVDQ
jgi:cytochrome c peroxidase